MYTKSAEQYAADRARAREIAEQMAALLTELDQIHPVVIAGQEVIGLDVVVTRRSGHWEAR